MIGGAVSAIQLLIIMILLAVTIYTLIIGRDNSRSAYMTFLLDLCLLWTLII